MEIFRDLSYISNMALTMHICVAKGLLNPPILTYHYLSIIKLHQFVCQMIPLWNIIVARRTLSAIKIFVLNFIV